MSAIGIIVMAGVVINDSILKVDTINKLKDNKSEPIFKQDNDENQLSLF